MIVMFQPEFDERARRVFRVGAVVLLALAFAVFVVGIACVCVI